MFVNLLPFPSTFTGFLYDCFLYDFTSVRMTFKALNYCCLIYVDFLSITFKSVLWTDIMLLYFKVIFISLQAHKCFLNVFILVCICVILVNWSQQNAEQKLGMVCLYFSVWAKKYLPTYKSFDGKKIVLYKNDILAASLVIKIMNSFYSLGCSTQNYVFYCRVVMQQCSSY